MVYEVIVDISNTQVDKVFDYSADFDIPVGSRVKVPFGNRITEGFVTARKLSSEHQTKNIIKILDDKPVLTQEMLTLARYLNERKNLRFIDIIRLCLPAKLRGGKVKELKKAFITLKNPKLIESLSERAAAQRAVCEFLEKKGGEYQTVLNKKFGSPAVKAVIDKGIASKTWVSQNREPYRDIKIDDKEIKLTLEQRQAVDAILAKEGEYLLHGVTGSGKTEIYMRVIEEQLKRGKTAIMLVPEISLTPQMLGLFRARFGEKVALLHSGLSHGERYDEWRKLRSGQAVVALGARSAVFAPLENVGVIIIDEEHDLSYISESNPRYITHDIARFRMRYNKGRLIYGSATPSLETYKKAKEGKYQLITLRRRVNEKRLPQMDIVDMRKEILQGNMSIFSRALLKELDKTIKENSQAMLFINRRGFASFVRCRQCGYIPKCADCEVSLTLHKEDNRLKCHYCGKQYHNIEECPKCGFKHLKEGRTGTQKVVEEINKLYPEVKVLRMDNDSVQRKDSYVKILSAFAEGKAQILVGTQMIVKGHDFPNVTLVGILDADLALYFPDYRSNENTFQLITQVAGRAGRDDKEGRVILQTYNPYHYVFRYAGNYDYCGFFEKESNVRETTHFPPYSVIARLLISSEDEDKAMETTRKGYELMKELKKQNPKEIFRAQAMRAPLRRIMNKHRFQIVVWINLEGEERILPKIYEKAKTLNTRGVSAFIEINPVQMM